MSDLFDEMAEDAEKSLNLPEDGQLGSVSKIAEQIIAEQQRVENLEAEHKAAKAKLLKLTDEELPAAMQELNMSAFALADGSQVTLKPTYGARIPKDKEEDAFEWLRQRNEADLIKNTVTVRFNKEQDNEAKALVDDLRKAHGTRTGFNDSPRNPKSLGEGQSRGWFGTGHGIVWCVGRTTSRNQEEQRWLIKK